jgi:polysaccharide biosynthesis transport protein
MSSNLPTPSPHPGALEPGYADPGTAMYRAGPGGDPGSNNLRLLWRRIVAAMWRYKWLTVVILLVGVSAGYVASRLLVEPRYAAQATLWIDASRSAPASQGPIQTTPLLDMSGWMELIKSFAVLDPVVEELRLYVQPAPGIAASVFDDFAVDSELRPGEYRLQVDRAGDEFTLVTRDGAVIQRGRVGEVVGHPVGFRWRPPARALAAGEQIDFTVQRPRDVARQLGHELSVRSRDRGNFLALGLMGSDPEAIAATLNAVTVRFVELAGELKRAQSEELTQLLAEQLQHAERNMQEAETSLQGFRVSTVTLPSDRVIQQAPGLQATQGTVFSNFFTLKMEREQLRRDREAIVTALERGSGGALSVTALEVVPSVRASSELSHALSELTSKRAELRALRNQFTDQYPAVQQLAEEVRTLEQQSVPRLASHVVGEIRTREAELDARLNSASGELQQIPERTIEETRHERSLAIASDLYRTLRGRYETARLAAVSALPDVQVLDAASPPRTPVNDTERTRLFLMFLVGSLGLAVAVPVLLDRVDSRLRYPEQVTHELGLPILGAVPHVAAGNGKAKGLKRDPTSGAVEALREIRLNISHAYGTAGPLLTTVTSPGVGDGKSFIASNLALAFADLGHRTLIIDGDIRRGQLHRLLGAVRIPGLTDYLAGNASAEEIVQATSFASLDIIACGTRMQTGPELLGSAAMASLIRELKARYEVVLIDSPPLGAGVDPFLLSTLTGNTLLVLRNGRTDREFALAKLDLLDRLPVRLLGAVLNDVPATGVYRYYTYLPGYEVEGEAMLDESETRQLEGV